MQVTLQGSIVIRRDPLQTDAIMQFFQEKPKKKLLAQVRFFVDDLKEGSMVIGYLEIPELYESLKKKKSVIRRIMCSTPKRILKLSK